MPVDLPTFRAWDFTQTIGVNTHISWKDSWSSYRDPAVLQKALDYLGVKHIRDAAPYADWIFPEYEALARKGVKFNFLVNGPKSRLADDVAFAARLQESVRGSVAGFEGANEYNVDNHVIEGRTSKGDPSWGQFFGPKMYAAVRANPALNGVQVLPATLSNHGPQHAATYGNVSAFADASNWHVYSGQGRQPNARFNATLPLARATAPGKPVVVTETGYYTAVQAMEYGGGGVTFDVQAIMTVNTVLDAFKHGVQRTYIYELLDDRANPSSTDLESSFGLFLADGTPKPAATAIRNLLTILDDDGADAASFTPGVLPATIDGLPATGTSLLMQKSNGAYDLVLWDEQKVWNQPTKSAVTPKTTALTVDLGASYATVKVFNPLSGTTPIQTLTNTSKVRLNLSAQPYVIEVSGTRAATAKPL